MRFGGQGGPELAESTNYGGFHRDATRLGTSMGQGPLRRIGLLIVCAFISGCIMNSVRSITRAPRTKPDAAHAIVVIGMGLDGPWPYKAFQLTFPEYSVEKQSITGNCFHYNRIEAARPSEPSKVTYLAFEVPANVYVYFGNPGAPLASSPVGHAFTAPPGGTVYFGDYILGDNKTVEFRRDINAARAGSKGLIPRAAVLEPAESASAPGARMFLCTP
jgi:hypothetical protein